MKNNFLKNIAFVMALALVAFASTFANASVSPPGKTKSISIVQNRFTVQTASPLLATVQDSVLKKTVGGIVNCPLATPIATAQFTDNQTANNQTANRNNTEINFSPPDFVFFAFRPDILPAPSHQRLQKISTDIDRNRHLVQRE